MKKKRLPSTREVLEQAERGGYALGAFNVSDLAVMKAVVQAAKKLHAPVIIETSSGETAYLGADLQAAVLDLYERQFQVPILINLDHAHRLSDVKDALSAGYEMIHFDGSLMKKSRNIQILRDIVRLAHRRGVLVEGELDYIAGSSAWHGSVNIRNVQRRIKMTDPEQARAFAQRTNIDLMAIFVGNVHGVYRSPKRLDLPRLRALHQKIPCWLSLHGGSSIPPRDIRYAIAHGVRKINVNTEIRLAYIRALHHALKKPKSIAPYAYMPSVIATVQKVVEEKIRLFGGAGTI